MPKDLFGEAKQPNTSPASKLDAVVEAWFTDTIPGSPAAATVESWNFLYAAKEDLKQRLAKETA